MKTHAHPFRAVRRLLVAVVCLTVASFAWAQAKKPEMEKVTGKVSSVERKGKAATLKVATDDGDDLDILVTTRMQFAVTAKSDQSILKPGVWVSCDNTVLNETNRLYFSKDYTVHLGVVPMAKVFRNANNGWDIAGQVAVVDKDSLTLKGNVKIMFDEGTCNVSVRTNDASLIEEGAAVEIEGIKRGEKFLPSKVTVALDKTLTADDLGANKSKTKAKTPAKTGKTGDAKSGDGKTGDGKTGDGKTGDGKTGDGKTGDGKTGDKDAATPDPFGVKPGTKPEKKADEPAVGKAADPFAKKPEATPLPKSSDPFKDKPKDPPPAEKKPEGTKS